MDHFNITIQDGAMISTRRGFKVSKQKHNGTAFINSSASNVATTRKESGSGSILPTSGELTFVNNGGDGRRSRRKNRGTTQDGHKTGSRSAGREAAHGRLSPGTRLSSTSPRTTVSDTFNSEQASNTSSANSLNHPEPIPLPPWAAYSHHSPARIDPAKRLRFMALAFGHNESSSSSNYTESHGCPPQQGEVKQPAEIIEKSTWQVHDPTTIHCALTMGALFDAAKSGRHETPQLTSLASQLYSIVNRRVSEAADRSDKARDVTIRAVASLAIISGYQGKSKHWHVHMQGLLNLLDIAGGQERLFPGTLDVIRCADIIGALSAATKPCTMLAGLPCKARYISRVGDSGDVAQAARASLEVFNFNKEILGTLVAAAKFCEDHVAKQDQEAASSSSLPQHYAPETLEDFYYLTHRLLTIPGPLLREYDEVIPSSSSPGAALDMSALHAAQHFPVLPNAGEQQQRSANNNDTSSNMRAIETALRILVLIYLKELMLDVPCNDDILLNLLANQVSLILSERQQRRLGALHQDAAEDAAEVSALVWICLAGHVFAMRKQPATTTATATAATWRGDSTGCCRVYKRLLGEIIKTAAAETASMDPSSQSILSSKDELSFCKCFDLRQIQGAAWDEQEAIRNMLRNDPG